MLGCVLSDAKRDEIIRGTEAIVQFLGNKDVDKQLVEVGGSISARTPLGRQHKTLLLMS